MELEASAKEEDLQRTEDDIAGEVDWLLDPGTASKRATQFIRTQAESWKVKTLLAKALESKEEVQQHSKREVSISDEQLNNMLEIYKSLDAKISAVHGVAELVNKKLTLLIKLLR